MDGSAVFLMYLHSLRLNRSVQLAVALVVDVVCLTLALETTAALLVLSIVVFAVVLQ